MFAYRVGGNVAAALHVLRGTVEASHIGLPERLNADRGCGGRPAQPHDGRDCNLPWDCLPMPLMALRGLVEGPMYDAEARAGY